jgi:hypothetical protein
MKRPELLMLDAPLFATTCVSIVVFLVVTHRALYNDKWDAIKRIPLTMAVSIGLSINNARAVLEGLLGRESEFVRTPKHGILVKDSNWISKKYKASSKNLGTFLELGFGLYFFVTIVLAVFTGSWAIIPFLVLFLIGFLYVGTLSLYQSR